MRNESGLVWGASCCCDPCFALLAGAQIAVAVSPPANLPSSPLPSCGRRRRSPLLPRDSCRRVSKVKNSQQRADQEQERRKTGISRPWHSPSAH